MDASAFRKVLYDFYHPPARQGLSSGSLIALIQALQDETVRAQDLQPFVEANPIYRDALLKVDILSRRISEWNTEVPQHGLEERVLLNRSLGLLGKIATRNALLSIAVQRSVGVPFPRKGPKQTGAKDILKVSPREQLVYALASEEFCQEHHFVSADQAFVAGLHYDYLILRCSQLKLPPDMKNAISEAHKEGVLIGRCAYQIAGKLKSVPLGKYLFAAAILLPIGKVFMHYTFPRDHKNPWGAWLAEIKKAGVLEWDLYEYQERFRFGVTHLDLSALFASFFRHLALIEPALAYSRNPFALRQIKPELYPLSMILSLARALAAQVTGLKTPADRIFLPFHMQWIRESKLAPEILPEIADAVKSGKDLSH